MGEQVNSEIVHLRDDRDSCGESTAWCVAYGPCTENWEEVTCCECLVLVATFAAGCAERLAALTAERDGGG